MIPKFTVSNTERVHIGKQYISNGCWLVTRDVCNSPVAPKALKPLLSIKEGSYHEGLKSGYCSYPPADMDAVIPKREGYLPLKTEPSGVEFKAIHDEILAYVFEADGIRIGIAPKYVPLLRLGHAFAKSATNPIIVLDSQDLNGQLLAVIMPIRLSERGKS